MKEIINVRLKQTRERSYKISIQPGMLEMLPDLIAGFPDARVVFIITDSTVKRLYGRRVLRAVLARGVDALLIDFPAGEESKNEHVVSTLQTQLLEHRIGRDSLIVALGGGVVGDVAGYVAATVLRGVEFIQVPTTLLSQVDSSVGGKVGIDHPVGKNLIGAFYQPSAVLIDPMVLQTLSVAEFRNGLAEIVKIAMALDGKLFRLIEKNAGEIRKENSTLLTGLITQSVGLKAAVVEQDEFEAGLRKTLNLGHTIGHAIESATGFSIKHGEGVAIGLATESRIALRMGLLKEADYRRLLSVLKKLHLPTGVPEMTDKTAFWTALSADKKSLRGVPRFVLPCEIGRSAIGVNVPTRLVEEVLSNSLNQKFHAR